MKGRRRGHALSCLFVNTIWCMAVNMEKHFCSCPVTACPRHPTNHGEGCDPCIQDNLRRKKMPACLFKAVHDDVSEVRDYSIQGFVEFYHKHQSEPSR